MNKKIIRPENILPDKRGVLCHGHFNSIHTGHIRYLKHAKEIGGRLYVALLNDGMNIREPRYQFNQIERADSLTAFEWIDYIILMKNDDLKPLLKSLDPGVLVLGREFEESIENNIVEAKEYIKQSNKRIVFHAGDINYASTEFLLESENNLHVKRKNDFKKTCDKQNLCYENLTSSMQSWNSSRVIVIGDTIVDQYAACEAIGMSAEAPVLVLKELGKKNFIGGAAIVAAHIKSLGPQCDFISVTGLDNEGDWIESQLIGAGINAELIKDKSRPTTFKKRYVVETQKLLRVSKFEDHHIESMIKKQVISKLEERAKVADAIVVSDFVYGVIDNEVLDAIHKIAKKHNLLLLGDAQCSSQVGSVTKFKEFTLLCPNEREARISLQDNFTGLELLSQRLILDTKSDRLIMKLGADGFIAYDRNSNGTIKSQAFPALSVNPLDVTGAGDALLAVMAAGLSSGNSLMTTSALACCASAVAVENMGNKPIRKEEIIEKLNSILPSINS